MRDETIERKVEMYRMYLEGYTLREIGDKFSVSKQYVSQTFMLRHSARERKTFNEIVYPNIKRWMDKSGTSIYELSKQLRPSTKSNCRWTTIAKILKGQSKMNIDDAKSIMKITGLSFEQVTERKDESC